MTLLRQAVSPVVTPLTAAGGGGDLAMVQKTAHARRAAARSASLGEVHIFQRWLLLLPSTAEAASTCQPVMANLENPATAIAMHTV